jgi:nucleoside-diphosphate-sugar epimerase
LPLADAYEVDDGAPNGYSLRDFAREAAAALDRPTRFLSVPRLAMATAALVQQGLTRLDGKPRILSSSKVREIFHSDWASHDRRLAAFLGWQPQIRLAEGFAQTIAWYRRKHWL